MGLIILFALAIAFCSEKEQEELEKLKLENKRLKTEITDLKERINDFESQRITTKKEIDEISEFGFRILCCPKDGKENFIEHQSKVLFLGVEEEVPEIKIKTLPDYHWSSFRPYICYKDSYEMEIQTKNYKRGSNSRKVSRCFKV